VGHGGTLDPDATGVLLVGLGRATRLLRFLSELAKTYEGEIVLGVATSSLDAAGEVTGTWDMSATTVDDVRAVVAARFVGELEQVPPMVSAVKVGGRRLHELARAGVEVQREARRVNVYRFDVEAGTEPGVFRATVECSAGTYVRSLAADVGTALGGGAHLRALRRTAVGPFTVDEARPLAVVGAADALPPAEALRGRARIAVGDEDVLKAVGYGKVLPRSELGADGDGPWAVVDASGGRLLAVYEAHKGDTVKPAVVLT
jgi:tRNA pseudouridine55 synthase